MSDIKNLIQGLETVSNLYAKTHDISRTDEWYMLKLSEELGELVQSYLKLTGQARSEDIDKKILRRNFEDEVVDVLGQILLLANHHKIDLNTALERKWFAWLPEESVSKKV